MSNNVRMGDFTSYESSEGNSITFSLTQDCQLRCKYCYMVDKNNKHIMTFEVAKKSIDYVLQARDIYSENAVQWEFIGGEPLLEIDLMDRICDYIKQKTYLMGHPWATNYMFNISTNGLLYSDERVQNFIKKNRSHLSVGISLDGNKEKNDNQRIYKDNRGSYDDVVKNIPLWLQQFPNAGTKATFSHGDIHLLKDSIVNLWDLGINEVAANVVFENVWDENDPIIFEEQLKELADYIIDNKLWNKYNVRFFDPSIGFPQSESENKGNFCGAGKMLSIDNEGNFYPCTRFMKFTLSNQSEIKIGNMSIGIDKNKIQPFKKLNINAISPKKCLECEVATGCSSCSGYNYDQSKYGSIFERSTAICEMHKANVRACEYFWKRYAEVTNSESERDRIRRIKELDRIKFLQVIASDEIAATCNYEINTTNFDNKMSEEKIDKAINFAKDNGFRPVILGEVNNSEKYSKYTNITNGKSDSNECIKIYDNCTSEKNEYNNVILRVNCSNISETAKTIEKITEKLNFSRVNLMFSDLENWCESNLEKYDEELDKVIDVIIQRAKCGQTIEVNVLSNINSSISTVCGCGAGKDLFALAPNDKIYLCPAFYFNNKNMYVGDIENGIDQENIDILNEKFDLLNDEYKDTACKKCIYVNKKQTNELYFTSNIQNKMTEIEIDKTKALMSRFLGR